MTSAGTSLREIHDVVKEICATLEEAPRSPVIDCVRAALAQVEHGLLEHCDPAAARLAEWSSLTHAERIARMERGLASLQALARGASRTVHP